MLGLEYDHTIEPQQNHHGTTDRQHVFRKFKERDLSPHNFVKEPQGNGTASRSEQGDDAARACHESHAHKKSLAEFRGLFLVRV